jgi:uncharacterized protein YjdB
MRNSIFIILYFILLSSAGTGYSQDVIFLHHSTGGGVYYEGNVAAWIDNYNTQHSTSYNVTERSYPNTPYPWQNYPYDYWNLWINNGCDNSDPDIECLSGLCANYNVIIFKHCFPGSDIVADDPSPTISSPKQTVANYKLQYRALRDLMDTYPNNKFIVWTLAPNHRLATNDADAARAKQFVDWVKNEWLSEDGESHPNIYIFDFWGIVAESNPSPVNGKVNCLKYDYELSHNDYNSHPNPLANETAGPVFAQFIVNTIENVENIKVTSITVTGDNGSNTITSNKGSLQLNAVISPDNASNKALTWSLQNGTGQASISTDGLVTAIADGTVTATATAADSSGIYGNLDITISGQTVAVTGITVTGTGGANTITSNGGTLQLSADVVPANASNNNITWSIQNGTGQASISGDGLVTAISNGTVTAIATATDGTGITGILTITIENQAIPTGLSDNKPETFVISLNSKELKIQTNNGITEATLTLYSIVGSPVYSKHMGNNERVFDISYLPTGIYIVLLRNETGFQKVVKVCKP